jgi:hypothetical protein
MTNSWIAMQIYTNKMTIWRHEIKRIKKELNNYELSRTKRNFQKLKKSTNYPNVQETQSRLLKDSRIKTIQLPNDQGFFKHVFGQNSNKVIFFSFFLCGSNQDFKIKPPFFFYIYIYIYVYISARTKQIKNLSVYVDFDQGSIKRTLTYD